MAKAQAGIGDAPGGFFNPEHAMQSYDYSNASKGQNPDKSGGTMWEATGDALKNVVKIADDFVKDDIASTVRQNVDAIQNIALGYHDDIARRAGSTDELTEAYRGGAISPSYYWMQMDQASRQLRAQYPGYRDEIDKEFSSRTGQVPANALIAENARQRASAADKAAVREEKFFDKMRDAYGLPAWATKDLAEGKQPNPDALKGWYFQKENEKARFEETERKYKLEDQQDKRNDKGRVADFRADWQATNRSFVSDWGKMLGEDSQAILKRADDMIRNPQNYNDTEKKDTQLALTQMKKFGQDNILNLKQKYSPYIKGERSAFDAEVASAQKDLDDQFKSYVDDKHIGILGAQVLSNELGQAGAVGRALQEPHIKAVGGIKAVAGDTLANLIIGSNTQVLDALSQGGAHVVLGDLVDPSKTVVQAVQGADNTGIPNPSGAKNVALDKVTMAMSDERGSADKRAKVVNNVFTPESTRDLDQLSPDAREKLIQKWGSKEFATSMGKLRDMGFTEEFNRYRNYMEAHFLANNRGAVQTVSENANNRFLNVRFDGNALRFIVDEVPDRGGANSGLDRLAQARYSKQAQDAGKKLNASMQALAQAWRASGMPEEEIQASIVKHIHTLGYDEAKKSDKPMETFWGSLAESMEKSPVEAVRNILAITKRRMTEYRPETTDEVTAGSIDEAKKAGRRVNLQEFPVTEARPVGAEGIPSWEEGQAPPTDTSVFDSTVGSGGGRQYDPFNDPTVTGSGDNGQSSSNRGTQTSGAAGDTGPGAALTPLLDFVSELESQGDYNATVGMRKKDFSNMTIKEVLDYQKSHLNPRNGYESSAVGKYQMLHSTLSDNVKWAGVSMNEKFTPEMQEKLNLVRLEKFRGLDDYRAGRISKEQFARNLAMEYASLPLSNGRSYYQGVGSNRSLTTYQKLLDSIPDRESLSAQTDAPELSGAEGVTSKGGTATDSMMQLAKDQHMAIVYGAQKVGTGEDAEGVPNPEPLKGILSENPSLEELEARINDSVLGPDARGDEEEMDAFNREVGGEFFGMYTKRKDAVIVGLNQAITDSQTMSQEQKDAWVDKLTQLYNQNAALAEKSRLAKNESNKKQGRFKGGESDATPASMIMNDFIKNELGKRMNLGFKITNDPDEYTPEEAAVSPLKDKERDPKLTAAYEANVMNAVSNGSIEKDLSTGLSIPNPSALKGLSKLTDPAEILRKLGAAVFDSTDEDEMDAFEAEEKFAGLYTKRMMGILDVLERNLDGRLPDSPDRDAWIAVRQAQGALQERSMQGQKDAERSHVAQGRAGGKRPMTPASQIRKKVLGRY